MIKASEILMGVYKLVILLSITESEDEETRNFCIICLEILGAELKMLIASMSKSQRTKLECQVFSFLNLSEKKGFFSYLESKKNWRKEEVIQIPPLLSKFVLEHFRIDFMKRICPTFIFYFRLIYREINKPELEWNLFAISSLLVDHPFINKSMKEEGLFFLGEYIQNCFEKNRMEEYSMALYSLSGYFHSGIYGVIKMDKTMSFHYIKLSVESDPENEKAMLALAKHYLWGEGTPMSTKKAIPLLEELSKEEYYCPEAKKILKRIRKQ